MIEDAEHGAPGAVRAHSGLAGLALAAGDVDFADNPLIFQPGVVGFRDDTDELVSDYAAVAHVAPSDFEVGVADAGDERPNARLAIAADGFGMLADELQASVED
jgi:hypothetical protein